MKKFMEPELNVIKFAVEDIITSSSQTPAPGTDNFGETDWDE